MLGSEHDLATTIDQYRNDKINLKQLVQFILQMLGTYVSLGALALVLSLLGIWPEISKVIGIFLVGVPTLIYAHRLTVVTRKLDQFYKRQADPTLLLQETLLTLLGGGNNHEPSPHAPDVAKQCENLIRSVSALLKDKNTWARQRYVQFVSSLMYSVVGLNAEQLSKLEDEDSSERTFRVPKTAAELADQILEAQMKELKEGDTYYVSSDLDSWKGEQLGKFFEETRRAVMERGVIVERLFNLLLPDETSSEEARKILRKHHDEAEKWNVNTSGGQYQLKIILESDWHEIKEKHPYLERDRVSSPQTCHFGVFEHENEMIRFRVARRDLSIMKLCRHRGTIEEESLELFKTLWSAAHILDKKIVGGIVFNRRIESRPSPSSSTLDEGSSLQGL